MPERRFTEQQVADIIRRATEAQNARRSPSATSASISADEVRRLGAELGVDPEALEEALGKTMLWSTSDKGSVYSMFRTWERHVPDAITLPEVVYSLRVLAPWRCVGPTTVNAKGELRCRVLAGMAWNVVTVSDSGEGIRIKARSNATATLLLPVLGGLLLTLWPMAMMASLQRSWYRDENLGWFISILLLLAIWVLAAWCVRSLLVFTNRKITRAMDEAAVSLAKNTLEREPNLLLSSRLHGQGRHLEDDEPRLDQRLGGG